MSRGEPITIRRQESIANEVALLNEKILKRAYEIFEDRGGVAGFDLDHWLIAERELAWKPPIELSEKNNALFLTVAVPGVDPREIQIEATPEDLVVKAEIRHEHHGDQAAIHACEFHRGSMFRMIHFPKQINPDHVTAEFKNGILSIHAPVSVRQIASDAA